MEWMIMPYKRYADFSGRSRRKEYWLFNLFFYLVLIIGVIIAFALDQVMPAADPNDPGVLATVIFVVLGLFFLASIIPHLAVTVRRFHDQDKSGWMFLLNFIPYVGGFVIIAFMCMQGTAGPNRFGPDPLNPGYDPEVFS